MFLKHLATPIKPLRDPLGGRDPQFEETCLKRRLAHNHWMPASHSNKPLTNQYIQASNHLSFAESDRQSRWVTVQPWTLTIC